MAHRAVVRQGACAMHVAYGVPGLQRDGSHRLVLSKQGEANWEHSTPVLIVALIALAVRNYFRIKWFFFQLKTPPTPLQPPLCHMASHSGCNTCAEQGQHKITLAWAHDASFPCGFFCFSELKVYHSMTLPRTAGKIKIGWNYFGDVSACYLSSAQCCQAKCLLSSINAQT